MTTVYWRKDEPDDFQVRDVNIPGVFPRPSLKINSSTVTTTMKPWLRPRNAHTTTRKHKHSIKSQGDSHSPDDQMAPLPANTTRVSDGKSKLTAKSKVSASLKDLSFEDKRRVTNLIKELAKAGEERKLAVNALHQERTIFQGKEESLKRQQEQLISERDDLREKILEYQFLINQYSKQIQQEKEDLDTEEKKSIAQERRGLSGNKSKKNELMTAKGNHKPPLPMRDFDEKVQTYYSVPASTDSRYCEEMPLTSEKNMADGNSGIINSNLANEPSHANVYEVKYTPLEEKSSMQTIAKPDTHHISIEKYDEKVDLEAQRILLEQQNKLLEQQSMIQQQLENLQILQQRYAEEFSQIITYSEDLKQAITAEKKTTKISQRQGEVHPGRVNTGISRETSSNEDSNNGKQSFKATSDVIDDCRQASLQCDESPYHKHDANSYTQKQGISVTDYRQFSQQERLDLDSYVNKSIEQIPGYLLHTGNAPSQDTAVSEILPSRLLPVDSNGKSVHMSNIHESDVLPAGNVMAKQWKPVIKQDMSAHLLHHPSPRKVSSLPLQSSMLSRENNQSMSNSNTENYTSHQESLDKSCKGNTYKSKKKQHSLLQSLEDFENNEHLDDEDENFFNPGSYNGFARSIMEGKYRNEQIFASTDYSDDESEPEDNELIADMFFLKRS